MFSFDAYASPESLPGSEATRIGVLLGLPDDEAMDEVGLADRIAVGLRASSAEALSAILGRASVVGPVIPEATLRRAKKERKALSREMSERLYEVGRVVDAVSRVYHGDEAAISRFLSQPHRLLSGRTPLQMAQSSSAGSDAVMKLLQRAEASFAV